MTTQSKGPVIVLNGVVQNWAPARGKGSGKLLMQDANGVEAELSIWEDKREKLLGARDPNSLVGNAVQVLAVYTDDFNGIAQYRPTQVTVAASHEPPQSVAEEVFSVLQADPVDTPSQPTGYAPSAREVWSAKGQETGNSKTAGSPIVAAYIMTHSGELPDTEWLVAAAACTNTYSAALRGMPLPDAIEEGEAQEEEAPEEGGALMVLSP
jgi:hypothetical protein